MPLLSLFLEHASILKQRIIVSAQLGSAYRATLAAGRTLVIEIIYYPHGLKWQIMELQSSVRLEL